MKSGQPPSTGPDLHQALREGLGHRRPPSEAAVRQNPWWRAPGSGSRRPATTNSHGSRRCLSRASLKPMAPLPDRQAAVNQCKSRRMADQTADLAGKLSERAAEPRLTRFGWASSQTSGTGTVEPTPRWTHRAERQLGAGGLPRPAAGPSGGWLTACHMRGNAPPGNARM
jgi:hypothetical protein